MVASFPDDFSVEKTESASLKELAFDSLPEAVIVCDESARLLEVNAAAVRLLRRTREDLMGARLHDLVPHQGAELAQMFARAREDAVREDAAREHMVIQLPFDSEVRAARLTVAKSAGQYFCMLRDVTDSERRSALLDRASRYMPGVLYQFRRDRSGNYTCPYLSGPLFGVSPEEVIADAGLLFANMHPDDLGNVVQSVEESARTLSPWSQEYRVRVDGEYRWFMGRSIPERELDGTIVWHGFTIDITQKREKDEEIARLTRQLRLAITSLDAGFAMYDADERLVIADDRYARIYDLEAGIVVPGRSYEEILEVATVRRSERFRDLFSNEKAKAWVAERLAAFREVAPSTEIELGDRWYRLEDRRTSDGGTVCLRTDITDLKNAVAQAESATKVKADFLATMSHEIRTPLNGVVGMANLLSRSELPQKELEFVETLRASAESLIVLVNDILDLSKLDAGGVALETIPFDLAKTVNEVFRLFLPSAEAKGISLEVQFGDDLPAVVLGDPTRLRQILTNLLGNAVKFTERGGVSLSIELRGKEGRTRDLVFRVIDTGIGMTPEQIAHLGEAFTQADASTTRRFGGSGLGLSIVKRLVGLIGGRFEVVSSPGEGSCFSLCLSMEEGELEIAGTRDSRRITLRPNVRVLVVDDNPVNRLIVRQMLASLVKEVVVAEDGQEAVDRYGEEGFDLVLMDCQMPRLDGFAATRLSREYESRNRRARVPVIALTANAMSGDNEACLAAGMADYLSKPLRTLELESMLTRYLGEESF